MNERVTSLVNKEQLNIKQTGIGNTINIEINLNDNSPFNNKPNNEMLNELIETLTDETCSKEYLVFICASDESVASSDSMKIFSDLVSSLSDNEIKFVVGGGKEIIESEFPYPHIHEYDLCNENKFGVIIIIADDYSTISQFSLLSHLKHNSDLKRTEMYVIYRDDIVNCNYLKNGPFDFFSDIVKGELIAFSDFDSSVLELLCNKIKKHRLFVSG
ncbi:hypothetical protein [Vibrio diabolicus]|uniref:hypothetical protein n=2 Tax=Vibrio harveyi group TaxID=717610 RepID=UPI0015F53B62|nr:hypothetical protein [Vibrio diabolicus]